MKTEAVSGFNIDLLDASDTGEMTVFARGEPTTWKWTFAGPGHDRTIAQTERLARERLKEAAAIEQTQINGRKWKSEADTVDATRLKNVNVIVERLLGWTPARVNGEDYPFSEENARKLLLDPKKDLFRQAMEFLAGEASFTPASAKT